MLAAEAEVKFSAVVLAVKLGLYASHKDLHKSDTTAKAIEVLAREARAFGATVEDHLHKTISDRKAALELARQGLATGSITTLSKRIDRARERSPAQLRRGK